VANTQMPTTAPTEPHVVAMKQAAVKAQQPAGDEVEVAEVFVTPQILMPTPPRGESANTCNAAKQRRAH